MQIEAWKTTRIVAWI